MKNRGLIKWEPFSTLLKTSDIIDLAQSKEIKTKPILTEEKIEELDCKIKKAINEDLMLEIKYWNNKEIKLSGKILKLNIYEKYILLDKSKIYFKDIIDIHLFDSY